MTYKEFLESTIKCICEEIPEFGEMPIQLAQQTLEKFLKECPAKYVSSHDPYMIIDALRNYLEVRYGMVFKRPSEIEVEWNDTWYRSENWENPSILEKEKQPWFDGGVK